jgi:hypothetical protein
MFLMSAILDGISSLVFLLTTISPAGLGMPSSCQWRLHIILTGLFFSYGM